MVRRLLAMGPLVALLFGAAAQAAPRGRSDPRDPLGRVAAARARQQDDVRSAFTSRGLAWPPAELYLRAFKEEPDGTPGVLELWAGNGRAPLQLVMSHRICALSGTPGPKRREGDGQIPEGFYTIATLNPASSFHLSMLVSYPNTSDRIRNRVVDPRAPLGGAIMVHGSCVTIGCIPIEDGPIEQIYLSVASVIDRSAVPIHIFPRRLDDESLAALTARAPPSSTVELWRELARGYAAFERTHRVPRVKVAADGAYVVTERGLPLPTTTPTTVTPTTTTQTATPQTATPQTATPQTATPQTATPQTATTQTATVTGPP